MGAYTCQHGTIHRMCRCMTPHTIVCPTPSACAGENYKAKHRADYRLLGEDVTGQSMGPAYVHDEDRECAFHPRLRLWVTWHPNLATFVECLRDGHPRRSPVTRGGMLTRDPGPPAMNRAEPPAGFATAEGCDG